MPRTIMQFGLRLHCYVKPGRGHYHTVDDERRAMTRSMPLMSDEAHSLGVEIAPQGAARFQIILDHIKDVVITANADGVIDRANPMTSRVLFWAPGELLGLRVDVLVPGIPSAFRRRRAICRSSN